MYIKISIHSNISGLAFSILYLGQTGKFVSRNRDLGCATFSERARRRAKFKNIASGAQILKVRAQKMKIV